MSDYGYPTTTNRAGAWVRRTSGSAKAVAPRIDSAKKDHLSSVLKPVMPEVVKETGCIGLDTEADRLRDMTNGNQAQMNMLGHAINNAIAASKMMYSSRIYRAYKCYLSTAEIKDRINWCINFALEMRFDARPRWSFDRICQRMPHHLMHHLRGESDQAIEHELARGMYAKNQIPRDLKPAEEDG